MQPTAGQHGPHRLHGHAAESNPIVPVAVLGKSAVLIELANALPHLATEEPGRDELRPRLVGMSHRLPARQLPLVVGDFRAPEVLSVGVDEHQLWSFGEALQLTFDFLRDESDRRSREMTAGRRATRGRHDCGRRIARRSAGGCSGPAGRIVRRCPPCHRSSRRPPR